MSNTIQRFDPWGYDDMAAYMKPDDLGDYVRYDEHQRITEALRGEVERSNALYVAQCERTGKACDERDQLRAEVERLKDENESLGWDYAAARDAHDSCLADLVACRAQLAQQQVPGWKLVPVEPTPEMVIAAEEAHMPFGDMDIALRMAMLAAPAPVQAEPASPWVADTEAAIQLAFELGGLEDGSYHLEADELQRVLRAALLANPAGQWVAVIERLPNVTQEVIVFSSFEGVCAGVLDSYGEWFAPCSEYKLTRVTHWMPLPSAPEVV